jgi:serine/threonine protein kinase
MGRAEKQERASVIIAECMRRKDAGKSVNPEKVLAAHPELSDELREYFDGEQMLGNLLDDGGRSAGKKKRKPVSKRSTVGPAAGDSVPNAGDSFQNLPAEFGRYRVQKVLGQGAMGAVYLAHDTKLARDVALKTPKLDVFEGGELVERFEREARSAATLHHRNICPVFDVGEIDGVRFLTMAYIEGKPLSAFVSEDKPMSRKQAATVVRKLALGLQEAHDHGVVHRDLKPANVMIDKSREPIVMDFGLARQTENTEQSRLTGVGVLMGSPAYMSPEQVGGEPDAVGPASDIYSLGVILFELLTGRLPYEGNVIAIIGQIVTADPPDVRKHRPDVDEKLAAICLKMMAKSTDDRFSSMKDVADALTDYLRGKKTSGSAKAGVQSIVASDFSLNEIIVSDAPLPGKRSSRKIRREKTKRSTDDRLKWIAGGLLGLIVLAVAIITFRDGTTIEVPDGKTVEIETNADGSLKSVAVAGTSADSTDNAGAATAAAPTDLAETSVPDDGFVDLFNGRDLTGWQPVGDKGWTVQDGILIGSGGAGWLMSDGEFENFQLELEYLLEEEGNSGVLLRAWPEGKTNGGDFHEIQLLDDTAPKYAKLEDTVRNGALYGQIAARPVLRPPPNQWHGMTIIVIDDQVQVQINGQQVVDGKLPSGKQRGGRIGLQLHGKTHVEFRNIRIKELSNKSQSTESHAKPRVAASWSTARPFDFGNNQGTDLSHIVYTHGDAPTRDLWMRTRSSLNEQWAPEIELQELNTGGDEASPYLSADGLTLIFESDRPGGSGGTDLWISTRLSVSDSWEVPQNMGTNVNSSDADGLAALSADGRSLIFASSRSGGYGLSDLWITERNSNAQSWSQAKNLGPAINTMHRELAPLLSADGLQLFFTSDRPYGQGSADIWSSRRESSDLEWTAPEHMGPRVNSRGYDYGHLLSPDGKCLLFTSRQRGKVGGFRYTTAGRQDSTTVPFSGDLAGTNWSVTDSDGESYVFHFQSDGKLHYEADRGRRTEGTWRRIGDDITITTNDGYSNIEGTLGESGLSGQGTALSGRSWTWQAQVQSAP